MIEKGPPKTFFPSLFLCLILNFGSSCLKSLGINDNQGSIDSEGQASKERRINYTWTCSHINQTFSAKLWRCTKIEMVGVILSQYLIKLDHHLRQHWLLAHWTPPPYSPCWAWTWRTPARPCTTWRCTACSAPGRSCRPGRRTDPGLTAWELTNLSCSVIHNLENRKIFHCWHWSGAGE